MVNTDTESTSHWNRLTQDIKLKVASYVHPNDVAANLKSVDTDTAAALRHQYAKLTLGEKRVRARRPRQEALERGSPAGSWEEPYRAQPWPSSQFVAHWGRPEPWRSQPLPRRQQLLCLAASSGDAESLEAALANCGCAIPPQALAAAAAAGHLAACERLLRGGATVSLKSVMAAARDGHLPVLQLLMKNAGAMRRDREAWRGLIDGAAWAACAGGHAAILAWLQQEHRYRVERDAVQGAAEGGQLGLLEAVLLPQPLPVANTGGPAPAAKAARYKALRAGRQRVEVLAEIAEGFPVDVMRRYWDRLWPWPAVSMPAGSMAAAADGSGAGAGTEAEAGGGDSTSAAAAAAATAAAAAAAAAVAAAAVAAAAAAAAAAARNEDADEEPYDEEPYDEEPYDEEQIHKPNDVLEVFSACVGSCTGSWEAKLAFLHSALGPQVLQRMGNSHFTLRTILVGAARHADYLPRLKWLLAAGYPITPAMAASVAVEGGHADALVFLWDECGMPVPRLQHGAPGHVLLQQGIDDVPWRLPAVRLLWERRVLSTPEELLRHSVFHSAELPDEALLTWLMETVQGACGGHAAAVEPHASKLFRFVAGRGVDLPLLQLLHKRWGALIDLQAVAAGGSLDALEWAAAQPASSLKRAVLATDELERVRQQGNLANVEWLKARGLIDRSLPKVDVMAQMMARMMADMHA
ncbi:hypothetical protein CHLRE_08g376250v5 [Chlamydomonas reinhardtii]|uniref:Uncharacterized protein n=1 Tax=Chlamydomonas reinhardtii TaxID=3055 RepID=A0A2K3DHQ5_CHLRE|nr:uncharacterized protein CHLRE_08g376250v5 [Chlamydomonas reinhardtii]PNW80061.1 hypothetical protein CHLRE_08g376250v5 [Chlamydomonas reinhardtii]